ncbi:MAG: 3-phosphoshikimate 1-carboxyvinyltransferase [Acidobacteriota bacterium]
MMDSYSKWIDGPVPSGRRVAGRVTPPSSKSLTHRYLNLALLARRPLVVERPLEAEDTLLFREALAAIGFAVEADGDRLRIRPPVAPATAADILCGNAGTMFRFVVASLATLPGAWRVDGVQRLRERPIAPLTAALAELGVELEGGDRAPLTVRGPSLAGGATKLDAGASSQYLSALLMAGQRATGPVTIEVSALTSLPYVDLTLQALADFGGRVEKLGAGRWRTVPSALDGCDRVRVEGDFSAVGYPAAAAALSGGEVTIDGVRRDSRQGDRGFLAVLETMGAEVQWNDGSVRVRGPAVLEGLTADLSAMPDQVPTLAALAPFARGVTRITNVPHLRVKESDRLAAMAEELTRVGATVEELDDGLVIPGVWADGPTPETPFETSSHGDHRIAMSLALVGLRRSAITIGQPAVVNKSYPAFWRDLARLLD